MKQRIEYIDAIKGLAIFLMVMGHAIAWKTMMTTTLFAIFIPNRQ